MAYPDARVRLFFTKALPKMGLLDGSQERVDYLKGDAGSILATGGNICSGFSMTIFFRRLFQTLLVAVFVLPSIPALAHSPYYTQTEKIVLPAGEIGEIRLIHGDGILDADPVWTVIVNAEGWVVARSEKAVPMVIVCGAKTQCRGFDLTENLVFEPDPAGFRKGPAALDNWSVIGDLKGRDGWGFQTRPATAIEVLEANMAFAKRNVLDVLLPCLCGALIAGSFFGIRQWPRRSGAIWIGAVILRLIIAVALLLLSLFWAILSVTPFYLWIAMTGLGAGATVLLIYLFQSRRLLFQRRAAA